MFSIPWPIWVFVTLAGSYYGSKYMLPKLPDFEPCNFEMQSFDMRGVPIYWQVEEAQCPAGDPNFDVYIPELEYMFGEKETSDWPKAECVVNVHGLFPLAVKFGTDFYEVEELDCKQKLEEELDRASREFDLKGFLQQGVRKGSNGMGTNLLMGLLG